MKDYLRMPRLPKDVFLRLMRRKEYLNIDFTGSHLKIAVLETSPGRKVIRGLARHEIASRSDDEIAQLIRDVLRGMKTTHPITFSVIPLQQTLTKNIEIPSVDYQEIDGIIKLQAGRHTPYSRDEIIVDYINLGVYGKNYTKVLLVIVKRDIVRRQFAILESAGVRLDHIVLAPESMGDIVLGVLKADSMDAPVCVLHFDYENTEFMVISGEKTVFVRSIPVGSLHLKLEKEKHQILFIEELKKSLEAYQGEDIDNPPQKFVLTGVLGEPVKALCPVMEEVLHIPARAQGYMEQIVVTKEAEQFQKTAQDVSFLGVMAPLLALDGTKVNLLPEEVKIRRAFEERSKEIITMGILMMSLFIFLFGAFVSKVYFKNTYLKMLTERYQPLNDEAAKIERQFNQVHAIQEYLSKRDLPLEVLTNLHSLTPEGIYLTQIKFDEETGLSVKGTSQTMAGVFSSVDTMEESVYFSNVSTRYATKRKEEDIDVTDFEIICLTHGEG